MKIDPYSANGLLEKHVLEYAVTDSKIERDFIQQLESNDEVVVYAKLPNGFKIPTPVGDYNLDWAITFKEGNVKHIYFVAETKGSISTMEFRDVEKAKMECLVASSIQLILVMTQLNMMLLVITRSFWQLFAIHDDE